jgi:2-dehydro-3-deoxyphosphogluconate aldolase/(4S)-4-hydroxy-2-oxoglutarate aldolase
VHKAKIKLLSKTEVLERIVGIGLIPVIRVETAELARRAIAAVRKGGIPVVEITMTVPSAVRIIEELRDEVGHDVIIGAGTVLDSQNARECIRAGAQFIVSPILDPETVATCNEEEIIVMPGAFTPTEIVRAWSLGADLVKVFPAGAAGGASFIKSLKGPLPHIKMVPTGGVSLKTAKAFIEAGAEALGVGGDLVDVAALSEGNDARIAERAQQFREIVREARGGHEMAPVTASRENG